MSPAATWLVLMAPLCLLLGCWAATWLAARYRLNVVALDLIWGTCFLSFTVGVLHATGHL